MSRGLVVVAQPGCKRLLGLLSALTKGHHPAPQLVSWDEALQSPQRLCTLGHSGDFLRVEAVFQAHSATDSGDPAGRGFWVFPKSLPRGNDKRSTLSGRILPHTS